VKPRNKKLFKRNFASFKITRSDIKVEDEGRDVNIEEGSELENEPRRDHSNARSINRYSKKCKSNRFSVREHPDDLYKLYATPNTPNKFSIFPTSAATSGSSKCQRNEQFY
jgi:hypothetical protein